MTLRVDPQGRCGSGERRDGFGIGERAVIIPPFATSKVELLAYYVGVYRRLDTEEKFKAPSGLSDPFLVRSAIQAVTGESDWHSAVNQNWRDLSEEE